MVLDNEPSLLRLFFPIILHEESTTLQENRKSRDIRYRVPIPIKYHFQFMHRQSVRSSSPIFESRKYRCFPISAKNFPPNYIPCTSRFRHIYQTCRGAQKRSTHLFEKTNPTRNTLTILCLDRPLIRTGNRA